VTIEIMDVLRDKSAEEFPAAPEELRGKNPDEMQRFVEVLDAHLRTIHQDEDTGELRDKTPAEQKAFDYGLKLRDAAIKRLEEHRAVQEVFRRRPKAVEDAMINIPASRDDAYGDVRRLTHAEARDKALRRLDDRGATAHMEADQKAWVERQVRRDTDIARRILVTETDAYRDAWLKLVTRTHPMLSEDERKAVEAWEEYRAMSEGTTTAGGFGIPVKLAA
jgi:hypothetical protein